MALVLACVGAPPTLAQEGGFTWSQFQGGARHAGVAAASPAPPYRQIWRFTPPEGALSGAVIADDLVIAVGERAVYALDLAAGDVAWEIPREGGPLSFPALGTAEGRNVLVYLEGPPADDGGASLSPTASPTPTGGDASEDANASELVAIDMTDRSELWRTTLEHRSRSGVTIDGDRAYVGDDDGAVYAIDLGDGAVAWTAKAIGRVESPVAAADGTVYVVAQHQDEPRVEVLALDAESGEPSWPKFSTSGYLASGASVGEGVVVFAVDRTVRALGAATGRVRWEALVHGLFWPVSAPASDAEASFVADESGGLYRIEASDGGRAWEHQTNERVVRGSPVVAGGSVVLGLAGGELAAFDPSTGDLISMTSATPGYVGAIALAPEILVAVKGGNEPGLVAFGNDPDGTLVREVSPTVPDAGMLFGAFALASVVAGTLILFPFRLLRRRIAPAFTRETEEETRAGSVEGNA